jgi:hypothetical protein
MGISTEYIAGLFDGEGTVNIITCNPCSVNRQASIRHNLICCIAMLDNRDSAPVFAHLVATYRGSLSRRKNGMISWTVSTNDAGAFLRDILPHLVIKKRQARLALRFLEEKGDCRGLFSQEKRHSRRTPEHVLETRDWYKNGLSRLKHRGPSSS